MEVNSTKSLEPTDTETQLLDLGRCQAAVASWEDRERTQQELHSDLAILKTTSDQLGPWPYTCGVIIHDLRRRQAVRQRIITFQDLAIWQDIHRSPRNCGPRTRRVGLYLEKTGTRISQRTMVGKHWIAAFVWLFRREHFALQYSQAPSNGAYPIERTTPWSCERV